MSGAELVRAYRAQPRTEVVAETKRPISRIAIAAAAVSVLAFGSIVVRAGDDSGVYEVARQYNPAKAVARLPQIFLPRPKEVVRTSLSFAPAPLVSQSAFGGNRADVDSARATNRITPAPSRQGAAKKPKKTVEQRDAEFEDAYLSSRTSYCVRTCDGFFFPVGTPEGGDLLAHQAACDRACPTAETDVFVAPAGSSGISDAVNRKGVRYEALRTAFNHRNQFDSACSCGPRGISRNYSVLNDFTLRKGDLIMSNRGLMEFRGAESFPYRERNFTRVDLKRMPQKDRKALSSIEAYSIRGISPEKVPASLKQQVSNQIEAAKRASLPAEPVPTAAPQKLSNLLVRDPRFIGPQQPLTAVP